MTRTHRMEPFLDLSLPVAEDKPTRPGKPCVAGAEDDDGEYQLITPSKSSGSGRPSKHAQKERNAARRANRHCQTAAAADATADESTPESERRQRQSSDSGQERDKPSEAPQNDETVWTEPGEAASAETAAAAPPTPDEHDGPGGADGDGDRDGSPVLTRSEWLSRALTTARWRRGTRRPPASAVC